jgi:putative FmdB family regulatory protein
MAEIYQGAERDGATLKRIIDAAVEARKDYISTGEEIEKYGYSKDYDFLYQEFADQFQNLFFKAKVNKTSEFVEVMGPQLYPYDPYYLVNTEEGADPTVHARHDVEAKYVNYLTRAGDRYRHGRDAVTHGLTFGRGVLWTGYNGRKGLVQSTAIHSKHILLDPDAGSLEEANILVRQRVKPRWELIQQFPDCEEHLKSVEKMAERPTDAKNKNNNAVSDLIAYYECYFLTGIHHYYDNMTFGGVVDDSPMKYVVCGEYVLQKGPWEIPFWRADRWPCRFLDLKRRPGKVWPQAPLEPALGHIRALNWIYTLYLSKMRLTTRTPLAVMTINGQGIDEENFCKLVYGGQMDIIKLSVNGENYKLDDFVKQFKWETGVEELERFVNIVTKEFEHASGLGEIMYFGQTDTQLRTAEDVRLKADTSKSRVNDMKTQVEKFMSEVGENERIAARYLEATPDRIAQLFGPQAGQAWGSLGSPEQVAQEQQMRSQLVAGQVQMLQNQATTMSRMPLPPGAMPPPPFDPNAAAQQVQASLPPPAFIDFDAWLHEASCDIEYGSMRPKNIQQQIDAVNVAMNQLPATVAMLPGGAALIGAIVADYTKLNNMSDELQGAAKLFAQTVASMPIAPPAPAAAPPGPASEDAGVIMPLYDYECQACGIMEISHPMAKSVKRCPLCKTQKFQRVFTVPPAGKIYGSAWENENNGRGRFIDYLGTMDKGQKAFYQTPEAYCRSPQEAIEKGKKKGLKLKLA